MSRSSFSPRRGWMFLFPDALMAGDPNGVSRSPAGLSLSPSGKLETVTGDAALRQSLLMLLLTSPGERVMRPHYGCDLRRLVFEPNDGTTAGLAVHAVRKAIARFEPRAKIVRLGAGVSPGRPDTLLIELVYRSRDGGHEQSLNLELDPQRGVSPASTQTRESDA